MNIFVSGRPMRITAVKISTKLTVPYIKTSFVFTHSLLPCITAANGQAAGVKIAMWQQYVKRTAIPAESNKRVPDKLKTTGSISIPTTTLLAKFVNSIATPKTSMIKSIGDFPAKTGVRIVVKKAVSPVAGVTSAADMGITAAVKISASH